MKHFYQLYYLILFFCSTIIFSLPAQANHTLGAELTYTHLNGNMYRLHLAYYRDCNGINAPSVVTISAVSLSCLDSTSYTLQQIANTGNEIFFPCPGHATTCTGGTEPGVQKWEYEADIAIPSQCPDWIFTFQECCIGGGNIQVTDLIVKAMLNNSTSDNNSPHFTNNPFIYWCVNSDDHYNNGMYDPDGDSLMTRLTCVPGAIYNGNYTCLQPFTSAPPITMDSVSGNFFAHPNTMEVATVAFEMLDYRNGVLMGSIMRVWTLYTIPCTNMLPTASGMNGTSQDSIFVFPDDTVCFDILSDDGDFGQEVTMSWDQTIPSATFDTAGGPHPTGSFCWVPTINDVRLHPYIFTVKVIDNNCPSHGANIYGYRIYVTLDSSLVWAGTKDPNIGNDISIYPNPSDGNFLLKQDENISSVRVFDHSGKIISGVRRKGNNFFMDAPPGVYLVEVLYNDGRILKKKILIE